MALIRQRWCCMLYSEEGTELAVPKAFFLPRGVYDHGPVQRGKKSPSLPLTFIRSYLCARVLFFRPNSMLTSYKWALTGSQTSSLFPLPSISSFLTFLLAVPPLPPHLDNGFYWNWRCSCVCCQYSHCLWVSSSLFSGLQGASFFCCPLKFHLINFSSLSFPFHHPPPNGCCWQPSDYIKNLLKAPILWGKMRYWVVL